MSAPEGTNEQQSRIVVPNGGPNYKLKGSRLREDITSSRFSRSAQEEATVEGENLDVIMDEEDRGEVVGRAQCKMPDLDRQDGPVAAKAQDPTPEKAPLGLNTKAQSNFFFFLLKIEDTFGHSCQL